MFPFSRNISASPTKVAETVLRKFQNVLSSSRRMSGVQKNLYSLRVW